MKKFFPMILTSIIVILFLGIFIYSKQNYSQASMENIAGFVDNRLVTVSNFQNSILVKPKERDAMVGYIFYPQNNIDEKSYIPVMAEVAQRGFNIYIIKTPLHLNLNTNKLGEQIVSTNQYIKKWVIGGVGEGEKSASDFHDKIKETGNAELVLYNDVIPVLDGNNYYCDRYYKENVLESSKNLLKYLNKVRN
ncbi:alpha/beta hydrolase [Clostridium sardiniense]|uniref:Alpha/beta hydrolase n=1 Tax=Clostridium sardiniense TaxID=29369 RepID=A0ABS7L201_CLOSR|nr:alpha/beta hydrolase [Clostridium sardiniense]MBY0757103.1 alpha/beta hydrolase [Clostridium sardiniense]MDQ0461439.1 hypothetical protein [Clostridium sardiniense]